MNPKYDFDEIVSIKSEVLKSKNKLKRYSSLTGIVAGKAQGEDGSWAYAVFLEVTACVWAFEEYELDPTGRFAPPETEPRETIRVVVNDKGEGEIKEDE